MRVAVLNRADLKHLPYPQWLPGCDVALFTPTPIAASLDVDHGYASVHPQDDYDGNPAVELAVRRSVAEDGPFDAIVAESEWDILRAARLREALGIPGLRPGPARRFRDKLVMKDVLRTSGVPIVEHLAVDSLDDLLEASTVLGFPFVIKPRLGVNSRGVEIIGDPRQLEDFASRSPDLRGDQPSYLLAEAYVDHEHYIVDGVCVDSQLVWAWPSWMSSNLGFVDNDPLLCSTLDPADPLKDPLVDFVRTAIEALGTPPSGVVHAEVFVRRSDQELLFNEAAARVGGGRINMMMEAAFGMSHLESSLRSLATASMTIPPPQPDRSSSWALLRPPSAPGIVGQIAPSTTQGHDGIWSYEALVGVGDSIQAPTAGTDAIQAVVTTGRDRAEAEHACQRIATWATSTVVIEP